MRRTTYAVCGTLMLVTAVVLRTLAGGGAEIVALAVVGLLTLVASADQRGKANG